MNGRSGPISPNSNDGSEWSGVSRYNYDGPPPYSLSQPHNRGKLITPPVSGSSNGTQGPMSNGMNRRPGDPSPPHSIARSSYGTTLSSSEAQKRKTEEMEEKLSQHYTILKRYLAQALRDEKGNPKPNRARDKLLRLSAVQFQELSTDVYDELLRRQSAAGQQTNGPGQVPPYLLPKDNFHPKRNQARQKLATLPPPRFRDLATDVFYELERRFPAFAARDISRMGSPAMSTRGGPPSRAATPNGIRPGYAPRNASLGSQVMAGLGIPGVEGQGDGYGRPTAKTFQSSTIVPNKSTMVEDDDDEGSDIYGSRRDTNYTSRSMGGSEKDRKLAEFEAQVGDFENRIGELQGIVKGLEERLRDKDRALGQFHQSQNEQQKAVDAERGRWVTLQSDLEGKLTEALNLNNNLRSELDKVRTNHANTERDLQGKVDLLSARANEGANEWKSRYENLDQAHQELQRQLLRQEQVTSDVKQEATGFLNQMKALSERSGQSFEREEKLVQQVQILENEIKDWKSRYARTKAQFGTLRASSTTTSIQQPDAEATARTGAFTAPDGLVKDIYITKFQIAIDELLRSVRGAELNAVLAHVKSVVIAVRNITLDMGDTQSGKDEQTQQRYKLKAKVSATANNLITASKNFATSHGLTPVSLLDAAASHLSASVIELIRVVRVRPTPVEELEDDEESSVDYYGLSGGGDSNHSSMSSPQTTQSITSQSKGPAPTKNGIPNGTSAAKPIHGIYEAPDSKIQELKTFLDSRTQSLHTSIQSLVSSIRTNAEPPDILDHLAAITSTTSQIVTATHNASSHDDKTVNSILQTLSGCAERLEDAGREGEEIGNEMDWQQFVKGLPPLAFEIARGAKELGGWVEGTGREGQEEFS